MTFLICHSFVFILFPFATGKSHLRPGNGVPVLVVDLTCQIFHLCGYGVSQLWRKVGLWGVGNVFHLVGRRAQCSVFDVFIGTGEIHIVVAGFAVTQYGDSHASIIICEGFIKCDVHQLNPIAWLPAALDDNVTLKHFCHIFHRYESAAYPKQTALCVLHPYNDMPFHLVSWIVAHVSYLDDLVTFQYLHVTFHINGLGLGEWTGGDNGSTHRHIVLIVVFIAPYLHRLLLVVIFLPILILKEGTTRLCR